ncbi:MAG: 5-formyltetrahydrofolate cyclo-ligase [Thiolinea sp.]
MLKSKIQKQLVWSRLKAVARPDSRFGYDFSRYIPDFDQSLLATNRLCGVESFQTARFIMVTPDNSLTELRCQLIKEQRLFIMPTYGIRRGFVLMEPNVVAKGQEHCAAWLDGMEHFGRYVSLRDIVSIGKLDFLITGASAVNLDGIRFGKGHGYFDIEWSIFSEIGLVNNQTKIAAITHDFQVVDESLFIKPEDVQIDYIATPTRLIEVMQRAVRPKGMNWKLLDPDLVEAIPPLLELKSSLGLI